MPSAPTTVMPPHESRSDNDLGRIVHFERQHQLVVLTTLMLRFVNIIVLRSLARISHQL